MPLSSIQAAILRRLASHRRPDSYVAGSVPLHVDGPRFSSDIDIFHDHEEQVAIVAAADGQALAEAGFDVAWTRREPGFQQAAITRGSDGTRLEWVRDSDFRFYPALPDDQFGYMLHPIDIATNKALAAVGRRVPRDALDLVHIHENHFALGAVLWAAVGKDPGYSPESLIAEIRRNSRYRDDDYATLHLTYTVDAGDVARRLRAALEAAESFVRAMPSGKEGLLFLDDGRIVEPDPARLDAYDVLAGRRQGLWPGSSEIGGAMLERYGGRDA